METAFLIGRIIVGAYYLMSAYNHFSKIEMMSGYAASKGVPSPRLLTGATGILLLIGGLSLLLGVRPDLGVLALALFLIPVSFKMHNFWAVQDPMAKMMEMVHFMKNMALLGSTLMFLAIPQPWPFGLGR